MLIFLSPLHPSCYTSGAPNLIQREDFFFLCNMIRLAVEAMSDSAGGLLLLTGRPGCQQQVVMATGQGAPPILSSPLCFGGYHSGNLIKYLYTFIVFTAGYKVSLQLIMLILALVLVSEKKPQFSYPFPLILKRLNQRKTRAIQKGRECNRFFQLNVSISLCSSKPRCPPQS